MSDLAADVNVLIQREEGRAALLASLGPALDNGDIYLVYQPKLHLRSGAVESVEALLRWDHPEFGSISPPVLIELVERAKQVEDLTLWVLRRAMAEQKALAKAGRILLMYVNVSGSLLSNNGFVDRLWELGTAGGIGIDVNETAITE
ncbi:MAG: EAL domain-containing protein, partial [Caulobacteraceae bacterium]|nr:EAL domain-containing protein [Caulobacteraceae bacterium]